MSIVGELRQRYDCIENDNHIILHYVDGELDEIHVGDAAEQSWTVIGYKDLVRALTPALVDVQRAFALIDVQKALAAPMGDIGKD